MGLKIPSSTKKMIHLAAIYQIKHLNIPTKQNHFGYIFENNIHGAKSSHFEIQKLQKAFLASLSYIHLKNHVID